jgi:hypothetical protein
MSDTNVIDFDKASDKHRSEREHKKKEDKVDELRQRFANVLPDRVRPVKDYLKKKRDKKKR